MDTQLDPSEDDTSQANSRSGWMAAPCQYHEGINPGAYAYPKPRG